MKNVNLKLSVLMLSALTLGAVSCKKEGCTDAAATNYDDKAKDDDVVVDVGSWTALPQYPRTEEENHHFC